MASLDSSVRALNHTPTRQRLFCRRGFTLLELLVVIAIIGILMALLMPAVQMVRESGRRIQCANQLKQQATAMLNYETAHKKLPPGFSYPNMTMWSAFILPYLDERALYSKIDVEQPWTSITGGPQENIDSLGVYLSVFQCPSSGVDQSQVDPLTDSERVPCCYLACASGLLDREAGDYPWCGMAKFEEHPASDGIFYMNSSTRLAEIIDGQSHTLLIGESLPDQYLFGVDYSGNPQKVDHWYIGSRELTFYTEIDGFNSAESSECLGSTACRINAIKLEDATIDEKELSFGSQHPTGVNISYADGSIHFMTRHVEPEVWSAMGTRAGGETDYFVDK